MARFVFKLDAPLKQRRLVEGEKRRVVTEIERQRLALEGQIRDLQQRIAASKDDLSARLTGRVDTNVIRAQAALTGQLEALIRQHAAQLADLYRRLQAARAELLTAARRRKAMEALRERRFEEWRLQQNRREAAALDDLVQTRQARTT